VSPTSTRLDDPRERPVPADPRPSPLPNRSGRCDADHGVAGASGSPPRAVEALAAGCGRRVGTEC
jgi:hypothetical protein